MKKFTALLMITLLAAAMLVPVSAAEKPVITLQPQNSVYPEFASALWSVGAKGENLSYDWYIVYNGTAYRTADAFAENHPWLNGVTGSGYGSNEAGDTFFVEGIGSALDGALIYCVVSNEAGSVTSESAYISVNGKKSPPQLKVPASVTVEQETVVKLLCEAEAVEGDSVSSYAWFETPTGQLKDIVAIGSSGGQPEDSSVIPVTVTEKTVVTQPPSGGSEVTDPQATSVPDGTSGPAATLPAGSETSPAGSGGHTGTDRVPGEKGGSRGTVIIVLAAVCGVLLGSCIALAAAAFRKKK